MNIVGDSTDGQWACVFQGGFGDSNEGSFENSFVEFLGPGKRVSWLPNRES